MGIFKKNIFDSIKDEETKIRGLLAYLDYIEKSKINTLVWIKKVKGTEDEKKAEEKLDKLSKEADEILEYAKNLEDRQQKQIEERIKKINQIRFH